MAAKKKSKKVKKTVKRSPKPDRVRRTEKEFLEHLIKVSENSITKQGTGIDEFFRSQADRLKKQLAGLKKEK